MYNVPILLLIFNRPNTTIKVFERIKQIKPQRLFISCDGPRKGNVQDQKAIIECKKIIEEIDWECDVQHNFYVENQGCNLAIIGGVNWFFQNVEEGVILEDDCLPSINFFNFCEEMLSKYRRDERISIISGTNFIPNSKQLNSDYYYSTLSHIWGWASWRRSWCEDVLELKHFQQLKLKDGFLRAKYKKQYINYFNYLFEKVALAPDSEITWDYRFFYHNLINNRLSIIPAVNLIKNIGFDGNGRSGVKKDLYNKKFKFLEFKTSNYLEPISFVPELEFDNYTLSKELKYGILSFRVTLLIKDWLEKKPVLRKKIKSLLNKL